MHGHVGRPLVPWRRGKTIVSALLALGLALAACSSGGAPTASSTTTGVHSSPNGGQSQIAWGRFDPSGLALFTANADGTNVHALLPGSGYEIPQWSPDGSKLAAVGAGADGLAVGGVGKGNGSGFHLFRAPLAGLNVPCWMWSPDGARLACEAWDNRRPSRNGLYTTRSSDGQDLQRLTRSPDGRHDVPCGYSQDGSRIAFLRPSLADEEQGELMVVNADGTNAHKLGHMKVDGCSWSPDGRTILTGAEGFLYRVSMNGSASRIRIQASGLASRAAWSSDGSRIIFSLDAGGGQKDIYTMLANGSNLIQITNTPSDEEFGTWRP